MLLLLMMMIPLPLLLAFAMLLFDICCHDELYDHKELPCPGRGLRPQMAHLALPGGDGGKS